MIEIGYRGRVNDDLTGGDEKPHQPGPDSGQRRHARQRGLELRRTGGGHTVNMQLPGLEGKRGELGAGRSGPRLCRLMLAYGTHRIQHLDEGDLPGRYRPRLWKM